MFSFHIHHPLQNIGYGCFYNLVIIFFLYKFICQHRQVLGGETYNYMKEVVIFILDEKCRCWEIPQDYRHHPQGFSPVIFYTAIQLYSCQYLQLLVLQMKILQFYFFFEIEDYSKYTPKIRIIPCTPTFCIERQYKHSIMSVSSI